MKAELDLLSRIKSAPMEARDRCECVWRILSRELIDSVDGAFKKKEAA
jgi:hypothetical protein